MESGSTPKGAQPLLLVLLLSHPPDLNQITNGFEARALSTPCMSSAPEDMDQNYGIINKSTEDHPKLVDHSSYPPFASTSAYGTVRRPMNKMCVFPHVSKTREEAKLGRGTGAQWLTFL